MHGPRYSSFTMILLRSNRYGDVLISQERLPAPVSAKP